jgi:hypothetical protein
VGRVLGLARIVEDRASQAVGGIEMLIGQAPERRGSIDLLGGPSRLRNGHVDGLRRWAHDDMTTGRSKTFMPAGYVNLDDATPYPLNSPRATLIVLLRYPWFLNTFD